MADDDLRTYRKTQPETPEEWQMVWQSVDRTKHGWIVIGPMAAFAENRKAWAFGLVLFLLLRRNELPAILEMITGAGK